MEEHNKQVLYQINFLNGFKLNESSLFENNPVSKNIEINQDNIIFYYDRVSEGAVCYGHGPIFSSLSPIF